MANCFLTLKLRDGGQVKGESTSKGYEEYIEIESWSWGEHHYQSSEQTSEGPGKVKMEDFHFTTTMTKASVQLMKGCAMADPVEEAVLKCLRDAGGGRQVYYTVTLKDGIISSFQAHSHESNDKHVLPVTAFSISFRQIEVEYKPQKAGGELGSPHRMQHDLGKGK